MPNERLFSAGFRTHVRREKSEFRRNGDPKSWQSVREFLSKTTPNYEDVYARYENVFIDWHAYRVEVAELALTKNFIQQAKEIRDRHMGPYENPKSKNYDSGLLTRLNPILRQITNEVQRSR